MHNNKIDLRSEFVVAFFLIILPFFFSSSSSSSSNRYSILRLKTIKCQSSQDQDTMAVHSTYFFYFLYNLKRKYCLVIFIYVNVNTCHYFLILIIQKHVRILIFYVNFIWFTCVCLSVCVFQQN